MPSSDKDKVRLLISDVGGASGTDFLFTNDEINTFLDLRGSIFRAAATALRTIAGNEAMVSKAITFLELSTSGDRVAKSLMDLADRFDAMDDEEDDVDIVEMDVNDFTRRRLQGLNF